MGEGRGEGRGDMRGGGYFFQQKISSLPRRWVFFQFEPGRFTSLYSSFRVAGFHRFLIFSYIISGILIHI